MLVAAKEEQSAQIAKLTALLRTADGVRVQLSSLRRSNLPRAVSDRPAYPFPGAEGRERPAHRDGQRQDAALTFFGRSTRTAPEQSAAERMLMH